MVGRILRSADFERVLARSPRSRSAHFAAHHVAARPAAPAAARRGRAEHNLSTDDARTCPPAVDDLSAGDCWLGTVVPKRHARRAVTRNLIKRQMRMVMSQMAAGLAGGLWVVRLRSPFDAGRFPSAASAALRQAARDELQLLLQRAARPPRDRPTPP